MALEVTAKIRDAQGTSASRRLRREGMVPGIVYGAGAEPTMIELVHNDLMKLLKIEAFHASLLSLNLGKAVETVLLRAVQVHPVRAQILHIDFQRVDPKKEINMRVPLHFINADKAKGVVNDGGSISHVMNEIEIRCLPNDLPEAIEVDVADLEANRSMHVSDIKWPKGVKPVVHGVEDQTIVTCVVIGDMPEGEEAAEAPAADASAESEE